MNAVTQIVVAFQENKRGCWRGFWVEVCVSITWWRVTEAPKHQILPELRDVCVPWAPQAKLGHPHGVVQCLVQLSSDYPQGWGSHNDIWSPTWLKMRLYLSTELPGAHRSGFITHLSFAQLLFWVPLSHSILQQEVLFLGPVWRTSLEGFHLTC